MGELHPEFYVFKLLPRKKKKKTYFHKIIYKKEKSIT